VTGCVDIFFFVSSASAISCLMVFVMRFAEVSSGSDAEIGGDGVFKGKGT